MKLETLLEDNEIKYREVLRTLTFFATQDHVKVIDISNFIYAMGYDKIFERSTLVNMTNLNISKESIIKILTELILESLESLNK